MFEFKMNYLTYALDIFLYSFYTNLSLKEYCKNIQKM